MRQICFGLSRAIGSLFFFVFASYFFYEVNEACNLLDYFQPANELEGSTKLTFLYIGTFVAGMIGLVIGQILGGLVPIRSDKACVFIDTVWHYTANYNIAWGALLVLAIGVEIVKEERLLQLSTGDGLVIAGIIMFISTLLAWVTLLFLYVIVPIFVRIVGLEFARLLARTSPYILAVSVGVSQYLIFGINLPIGIIAGLVVPLFVIPMSIELKNKDYARRVKANIDGS